MSCVSLITADIDQAFEACSASAVLPAWRHISQSYESRFSSNSILVRRGRRELCKLGRSQSFGRGWLSFSTPVLARALFSFTSVSLVMVGSMVWQSRDIPLGGVMSSAAVAVVLGAAELVWLDQQQKHRRLGFHFWEVCVFCCSCIFVFMRACYLVPLSLVSGAGTAVHTWLDVELRVVGQHVAVNIKNPNRQQKSHFLPWTGVRKGGLGSIWDVVLGHLARSKMLGLPEQLWAACLLEDVVELVFLEYPLSVIRGLVHSLNCSRVAQICRKNCANVVGFLAESNGA